MTDGPPMNLPLGSPVGDWRGMLVLCAANSWDTPNKMADRHLAEHLARHAPVLYVDPPMSRLTTLRHPELSAALEEPRLRLVAPGLARLTPVVLPGPQRPGMARVTAILLRRSLRRVTRALGGSVQAVITTWPLLPVLGTCDERVKVYWAQDDVVGGARLLGLSAGRLQRGESAVAAQADLIVAANPTLADAWRRRGHPSYLVPFGCDSGLFATSDEAPAPPDVRLPAPVAGFIGYLGDRIDIRLLEAVAERGRSLLLVGPRHPRFAIAAMASLLDRPNVQWVGPKRFEELPSYQRIIDVGLVPYSPSAFNLGSFPLKTLEYLAAGRAVVATDLPAVRWLNTELVAVARDPESFADAVDRALGQPRTAELIARRRGFAAKHSWANRAADFSEILGVPATRANAFVRSSA